MEIRMIETFLKVSSTQNFSKAAEQLGYSQSAVTVQIQKLESELGVYLFERIGKRAYLTQKGRDFVPYAEELMKAYTSALNFDKDEKVLTGELKIGGVESVCTALLPKLLIEFYKVCPSVEVTIKSGVTDDLMAMAESNDLDMVLTLDEKIYDPRFISAAEKKEDIVFVSSSEKEGNNPEALEKLCFEPFLLTERNAPYRHALDRILAERNLRIDPMLEIGNTETIINLLKKGAGMSFLPEFTVEDDIKSGKLNEIKSDFPKIQMYIQLLYHKSKWVTGQMQVFERLVKENFQTKKDIL